MDEHEKPLVVTPLVDNDIQILLNELTSLDTVDDTVMTCTEAAAFADQLTKFVARLRRTFG